MSSVGAKRPRPHPLPPKGSSLTYEPAEPPGATVADAACPDSRAATSGAGGPSSAAAAAVVPQRKSAAGPGQQRVNAGATCFLSSSLSTLAGVTSGIVPAVDPHAQYAAEAAGSELATLFPVYTMLRELYDRYARGTLIDAAFVQGLLESLLCYGCDFNTQVQEDARESLRELLGALHGELQLLSFLSVRLPFLPPVLPSGAPTSCFVAVALRLAALIVSLLDDVAEHAVLSLSAIEVGAEPALAPLRAVLLAPRPPGGAASAAAAAGDVAATGAETGWDTLPSARSAAAFCARVLRDVTSSASASTHAGAAARRSSKDLAGYVRSMRDGYAAGIPPLLDDALLALAWSLDRADSEPLSPLLAALQFQPAAAEQPPARRVGGRQEPPAAGAVVSGLPTRAQLVATCSTDGPRALIDLVGLLKSRPAAAVPASFLRGELSRHWKCPLCQTWVEYVHGEPFNLLTLDMPALPSPCPPLFAHDLYDLLGLELSADRSLEEPWACSGCVAGSRKKTLGARQSNRIASLPTVLALDIKRFYWSKSQSQLLLRRDDVVFPLELNLRRFTSSGVDAWYVLYSMNSYLSDNDRGFPGHYISFVKGQPPHVAAAGGWCVLNDYKPMKVRVEDVLGQAALPGLGSRPCVTQLCYFRRPAAAAAAVVIDLSPDSPDGADYSVDPVVVDLTEG